jgi:hypothetical protein
MSQLRLVVLTSMLLATSLLMDMVVRIMKDVVKRWHGIAFHCEQYL